MSRQARLTVKSVAGYCSAGHKVGETFITDGVTIRGEQGQGICIFAVPSFTPYIAAFCRETPESDWINQLSELQCPDSSNTVKFSIERID